MNTLKRGEGAPLLNFVGDPGVPLLNFEEGPGVPLLNFERDPGSRGPGATFTPCLVEYLVECLVELCFTSLNVYFNV